ncbi:general substrate transporter [Penicillium subrubescens]|uniref:Maltose permease MAL31 n=1 Tax=Penicillium subrubescens TaxID=1316194 RepID=A0A1Q5UK66_9EURO|nr:general substrate transporter [Penicillium subrubescens]KAJ5905583.1 general substrate transporter [Penicillium subrubescens]OKP12878.1 Maltose permease MAL31 [Penicillium subrubescens]
MASAHVEDKSATPSNYLEEVLEEANHATQREHELTLLPSLRLYPKAIAWSMFLSLAIIMEGYDTKLMGTFLAAPAFQKRYGHQYKPGKYQITAAWQAGLNNGSSVGSIIGLLLNGYVSERFGFRKTMLASLALITVLIFIPFFAPSIEVLQVGQVLMGIPWGVFQTLTTSYAAEVAPTHLRAYLTTYVNLCWVLGQLLASGVLRAVLNRTDEWAYRIPFALQWVWPIPLMIGIAFAPESPWWLVRKNRLDEAKAALLRLTSPNRIEFDVDEAVALMVVTTENEREAGTGVRYLDCFRGVDRRRTIIACCVWCVQILSGTGLRIYSTYFYQQAGLPTASAFNMTIVQYALGIVGVFIAWAMLPRFGRRTLYLWGLVILAVTLLVIGGLGVAEDFSNSSQKIQLAWAVGSLLLVYAFFYDVTIGPVCYSLVAEIPSVQLRTKSVVLARASYNILNIISNIITPYMLNPSAWNWGAKAGFFYGGTCLLSVIYTYFCIPEPIGRTYGELNVLFRQKVSARKFATTQVTLPDARELPTEPKNE